MSAAIFDLDRTLLPRATGPVFINQLSKRELVRSSDHPIAEFFVWVFNTFGESRLTMSVAHRLVRSSKGWPIEVVADAAEAAADELVDQISPFAKAEIETHRDAKRTLVLATTSPLAFVKPLADRLGFDHVIATQWASIDGTYTGDYGGPFIWGPAKRDAVLEWLADNNIKPRRCYAYSDSYYDSSLLDAIGHPVAVNPDPALTIAAVLNGWPMRSFEAPPGVLKLLGLELQEWLRPFNRPEGLAAMANFEFHNIENIPATGPTIVAFNHRSYFDTLALNFLFSKVGRPVRFLGKREVFDAPLIGQFAQLAGGIPVDRGTGSAAPLRAAISALDAGEMVVIAPQGTIPRGPAFFEPKLQLRHGAARLAAATKAPVIPVGLWGTERVWPRNQRVPNLITATPPQVSVNVGTAVELSYDDIDADTETLAEALVAQLPAEARRKRTPTEEELARTYPPGYRGDPSKEVNRRPGTDT